MKPFIVRISLYLLLASCADEGGDGPSPEASVSHAAILCDKPIHEMHWLQSIHDKAKTDVSFQGDIYAVTVDNRLIFVHQPMVSSCWACLLYDCEGNKLSTGSVDQKQVIAKMTPENKIYNYFQ